VQLKLLDKMVVNDDAGALAFKKSWAGEISIWPNMTSNIVQWSRV